MGRPIMYVYSHMTRTESEERLSQANDASLGTSLSADSWKLYLSLAEGVDQEVFDRLSSDLETILLFVT